MFFPRDSDSERENLSKRKHRVEPARASLMILMCFNILYNSIAVLNVEKVQQHVQTSLHISHIVAQQITLCLSLFLLRFSKPGLQRLVPF